MAEYLNDGTADAPKLRVYLNLDTLFALPSHSIGSGLAWPAAAERIEADGFEGVQLGGDHSPLQGGRLPYCGLDRLDAPEDADTVFSKHKQRGDSCLTLHLGTGIEDDATAHRLVEATLTASETHDLPAFIETHRATITQDLWRTVRLTETFPEVRFNGDFSHYYCGQEMVYGDFEARLDFMQPIFDRTGFLHGRIAAPGFMQAPIEHLSERPRMAVGVDYLAHFKEMWRRAMAGFKANAGAGDVLIFAPELLASTIYYARVFPDAGGGLVEESDRYAESILYAAIAREAFEECVF